MAYLKGPNSDGGSCGAGDGGSNGSSSNSCSRRSRCRSSSSSCEAELWDDLLDGSHVEDKGIDRLAEDYHVHWLGSAGNHGSQGPHQHHQNLHGACITELPA